MILFGWGFNTHRKYGVLMTQECNLCRKITDWNLCNRTTWFTLFFIPVIPYKSEGCIVCSSCKGFIALSDAEFEESRKIVKNLKQGMKEPTYNQINQPQQPLYPTATIENVWQEHDVTENGVLGMKIHIKFRVFNLLNKSGIVAAWFNYRDGRMLMDSNGLYNTSDGSVAVSAYFTPPYADTAYDDFVLFLPYSELHLASNVRTDLSFYVGILDDYNVSIAITPSYNFWYGGNED